MSDEPGLSPYQAAERLKGVQKAHAATIDDMAVVEKDENGKVHVQHGVDTTTAGGSIVGGALGLAVLGAGVILLLVLVAIFAPVIARQDPYYQDYSALKQPPSREHILGTDALGRDMWARLIYATRVSLSVGLVAVAIYTLIGTVLGAIAGYYGGKVDAVIMRVRKPPPLRPAWSRLEAS